MGGKWDRVIFADLMRGLVLTAIVASTTILGYFDVIDATAASAILGGVAGGVTSAGGAAVGGRAAKAVNENQVN